MFRSRSPSYNQSGSSPTNVTNVNHLFVSVQNFLAIVLPDPIVAILAALSEAIYRIIFGKTDAESSTSSYTSTLGPPAILIIVTYLVLLLAYKSLRSFLGMIIFSIKWALILGIIGFLLAWHYGNGDVQQGAQTIAHQSGVSSSSWTSIFQKYPSAQQYVPFLANLPNAFGQQASQWINSNSASTSSGSVDYNPRGYRDLRPSRRYSGNNSPGVDSNQVASDTNVDYLGRFSQWIGADFGAQSSSSTQRRRKSQR